MKAFYVAEESPKGNFTVLAECDDHESALQFVRGQVGRPLHVCNANERVEVVADRWGVVTPVEVAS